MSPTGQSDMCLQQYWFKVIIIVQVSAIARMQKYNVQSKASSHIYLQINDILDFMCFQWVCVLVCSTIFNKHIWFQECQETLYYPNSVSMYLKRCEHFLVSQYASVQYEISTGSRLLAHKAFLSEQLFNCCCFPCFIFNSFLHSLH
jgi:hypothetical protein